MSLAKTKARIRTKIRRRRVELEKEYRDRADSLIASKFLSFLDAFSDVKSIGLYWATEYEVGTRWLLEELYARNYICALPKIDARGMCFVGWTPITIMKPNARLRFIEAIGTEEIIPDLIVVPFLTCDAKGNRLGSGEGWYDRYLADHKAVKVGLCYSKMLSGSVPHEQHDIHLDTIITENKIY